MMFYMDSKVFEKEFLNNETDKDILNTQYIIVSTRIRISDNYKYDNIVNMKTELFPDSLVCSALDDDSLREAYFDQLNNNITLLSYLIKGSIKDKLNIVFLCTKKESKIKYLKYLSEFSLMEFGYPIYDYDKYCNYKQQDVSYDEKTVLKICESYIKEAKGKSYDNISDKEIKKDIKDLSKKSLVKELKRLNLYTKGMDKYQMRELLEYYLT